MSRYPYIGRATGGDFYAYDRNLVDAAPEVSRQDRQDGYRISILDRPPQTSEAAATSSPFHPRPHDSAPPPRETYDTPTGLLTKELYANEAMSSASSVIKRKPWYRRKQGIIILVLGFLIFVAIIVGIAVGVSEAKKRSRESANEASLQTTSISPVRTTTTPSTPDRQPNESASPPTPATTRSRPPTPTPTPPTPLDGVEPPTSPPTPSNGAGDEDPGSPWFCFFWPFDPDCD